MGCPCSTPAAAVANPPSAPQQNNLPTLLTSSAARATQAAKAAAESKLGKSSSVPSADGGLFGAVQSKLGQRKDKLMAKRHETQAQNTKKSKGNGPTWNSFEDSEKIEGRKPIVCVAGMASSSLEARIEGSDEYEVTYCSIKALMTKPKTTLEKLRMEVTDGRLKDGRIVPCTTDQPGVTQRPVQGTAGIRSLNPGELAGVDVWKGFVNDMEYAANVHAFNYDWRRWGDQVYAEEMEVNFQRTIEEAYALGGHQRTTVVGHSMGASVILYMLSVLGEHWAQTHVEDIVLVAPAHVGAPCMLPNLAHGVIGNTAGMVDLLLPSRLVELVEHMEFGMAKICGSWACMAAEMPMNVGDIAAYDENHVFARTPDRTYTYAQLGDFLADAGHHSNGTNVAAKLWPGVQELYSKIKTPAVRTHVIYVDQIETVTEVGYDTNDVTEQCVDTVTEPGDGTITADAIERVAQEWIRRGADVHLVKCAEKVSHKNLIVDDFTVLYVQDLVGGFDPDSEIDSDSDSDFEE